MNEIIVTTAVALLPFLIGIIAFWIKRYINTSSANDIETKSSIDGIKTHLAGVESDITNIKHEIKSIVTTTGRLESSVSNVKTRINEEVAVRDRKFNRQADKIIELGKNLAIVQTQVNDLRSGRT